MGGSAKAHLHRLSLEGTVWCSPFGSPHHTKVAASNPARNRTKQPASGSRSAEQPMTSDRSQNSVYLYVPKAVATLRTTTDLSTTSFHMELRSEAKKTQKARRTRRTPHEVATE